MKKLLQRAIYEKGTEEQLNLIAELGAMSETEKKILFLLHNGCNELDIQSEIGLTQKPYDDEEESVRMKTAIGIFDCINYRIFNSHK